MEGPRAGDVWRVEVVEDPSKLRFLARLVGALLAQGTGGAGASICVRVVRRATEAIVLEHRWESGVSADAEASLMAERLQSMTPSEFREAYNLPTD